ncbi:MAG: 50S ribosomal protein L18e [Nitrososphaerota archaeon]|jgi:large subunit ribosomal protein L18e|nr:50S ribosomal protein L18e [Nitrososphaerota archaeon]MDG7040155.1 50S ribosomal protein L18e [Nitrososphaerota archaeon]MDG7041655.1 50S ribosomal protein L18e [Nitrososphaerota archaeon]MDG7043310.1 50S ribosomal protein L18e [Nitrososphaerota archaeon]MDG7045508.1 50S ribosomal protein L18e [Nitrososphaerota archaeon]
MIGHGEDELKSLKDAYRKTKRSIWNDLYRRIKHSSRSEFTRINTSKLNRVAPEGAFIVVPGKVLGTGNIDKKITVGALAYSKAARARIEDAGGKAMTFSEFVASYSNKGGIMVVK